MSHYPWISVDNISQVTSLTIWSAQIYHPDFCPKEGFSQLLSELPAKWDPSLVAFDFWLASVYHAVLSTDKSTFLPILLPEHRKLLSVSAISHSFQSNNLYAILMCYESPQPPPHSISEGKSQLVNSRKGPNLSMAGSACTHREGGLTGAHLLGLSVTVITVKGLEKVVLR